MTMMLHDTFTFDIVLSLQDTIEVVKKFMARDPTELNFTLTALAKND